MVLVLKEKGQLDILLADSLPFYSPLYLKKKTETQRVKILRNFSYFSRKASPMKKPRKRGEAEKEYPEERERASKEEAVEVPLDELKMMIEKLNEQEIYQKKSLEFHLIDDRETLLVEIRTTEGRLVQDLLPGQVFVLYSKLMKSAGLLVTGSLLDISIS